jgi:hypothetical protein
MSAKNVLLVVLVLVNLMLLTILVPEWTAPRTAQAQPGPGGGNNYMAVTARLAGNNEDVLWILDLKNRKLHAYRLPQVGNKVMVWLGTRDVANDLRPAPAGKGGP